MLASGGRVGAAAPLLVLIWLGGATVSLAVSTSSGLASHADLSLSAAGRTSEVTPVEVEDGWLACADVPGLVTQPWFDAAPAVIDLAAWCPIEHWATDGLAGHVDVDWATFDQANATITAHPPHPDATAPTAVRATLWLLRLDPDLGWFADATVEFQWAPALPAAGTLELLRVRPAYAADRASALLPTASELVLLEARGGPVNLSGLTLTQHGASRALPAAWLDEGERLLLTPGAAERVAILVTPLLDPQPWHGEHDLQTFLPGLADGADSVWLSDREGTLLTGVGWGAPAPDEPPMPRLTGGAGDLVRWSGDWFDDLAAPDGPPTESGPHWRRLMPNTASTPASLPSNGTATTLEPLASLAAINATSIQLCPTPHGCGRLLLDAIEAAEHDLLLAIYQLTSPELGAALQAAAERGVDVRVLADPSPVGWSMTTQDEAAWSEGRSSVVEPLAERAILQGIERHGGEVRWYTGPGHLHAKLLVVDDDELWVGSENWKPSGYPRISDIDAGSGNRGVLVGVNAEPDALRPMLDPWQEAFDQGRSWTSSDAPPAWHDPASPSEATDVTPLVRTVGPDVVRLVERGPSWGRVLAALGEADGPVHVQALGMGPEWAAPGHRTEACPLEVQGELVDLVRGECVALSPWLEFLRAKAAAGETVHVQLDPSHVHSGEADAMRLRDLLAATEGDAEVRLQVPPGTTQIHAKTVVSGGLAVVGSTNLDQAAMLINAEVSLVLEGPAARVMAEWLAADWNHTTLVEAERTEPSSRGAGSDEGLPWPGSMLLFSALLMAAILRRSNASLRPHLGGRSATNLQEPGTGRAPCRQPAVDGVGEER